MADDKTKFVADDGYSEVPQPVKPEGGEIVKKKKGEVEAKKKSDVKTPGQEKAGEKVLTAEEVETTDEVVEEVVQIENSIESIFEGTDLSEEFKANIKLVFEAAVNEQVASKTDSLKEDLESKLETELSEAIDNRMKDVVENVDKYLDYVVGEWMEENKIAVEAGIKVEMAESLLDGLKGLFTEHNIEVSEETFDVVESLEKQVSELEEGTNTVVNENIELKGVISSMKAVKVFEGMVSGLSENQIERFKVLSEKLDVEDADAYAENLSVIKESFFSEGKIATPKVEDVEEDEIILEEQEVQKPTSDYTSINALVEAFNIKK